MIDLTTAMPGDIEEIAQRVEGWSRVISSPTEPRFKQDLADGAAALRSLVLERTERIVANGELALRIVNAEQHIAQLEAIVAQIQPPNDIGDNCTVELAVKCAQLEAALAKATAAKAKPLTKPEGLPEGPWTIHEQHDGWMILSREGFIVGLIGKENIARAIASLPDLYAELATTKEERDQFLEQAAARDERDRDMQELMRLNNELVAALAAARNKMIEECAQVAETCGFETPVRIAQCIRTLATRL